MSTTTTSAESLSEEALRKRVAELEAKLRSTTEALSAVTAERDKLRRAYEKVLGQLELQRRRIYVAKAERIDTRQLEIDFAETKAKLNALAKELGDESLEFHEEDFAETGDDGSTPGRRRRRAGGRPDLRDIHMPEERIEITDPAHEGAKPITFEETCLLGYRRGGPVRIVMARAIYKVAGESDEAELVTAAKPKELYERGMLAPSFVAHILTKKYRFGMPFHRLAEELASEGISVSDSTMCRYAEHVGASLGCIVDACAKEAKTTAFCLSTDATGVAIQPGRIVDGKRGPCAKGHFFVVLADKDHVFFEYQPKHTSEAVCSMFKGFSGYIQADAHCVYDALFRGDARESEDDKPPDEVGCWSHARRKFWEAAVTTKDDSAQEALLRIRELFKLEAKWADLAPKQRHARRQQASRAIVDEFFAWANGVYERVRSVRGPVATAFGYATRHEAAFRRFLDDGRLRLENNASERALRHIAIGRKAWLFFGSDDHAQAGANLFSLIASCKLHGLDAEAYLAEVIRVVPYWPRDRYLELAPKYWAATRALLDPVELERPIGHVTVPIATSAEQQASTR